MKVLVDTTVFVDFLRGRSIPKFEGYLAENAVLLSPIVRLELIQGVKKEEFRRLNYVLGGLESVIHDGSVVMRAETILQDLKGSGYVIGIPDLFVAAEAQGLNCPVYSYDKIFQKLAKKKLIPGLISD